MLEKTWLLPGPANVMSELSPGSRCVSQEGKRLFIRVQGPLPSSYWAISTLRVDCVGLSPSSLERVCEDSYHSRIL